MGWLRGISLRDREERLVLNLSIDQRSTYSSWPFSPDGKRVAWGNTDGSVMVADLDEIQSRLGRVGLSWVPTLHSIEE
jgi:hypothetical protein